LLWTVFVLSIHVIWSICTPILIAEGVAGTRRTTPWLGWVGLRLTAALYVLGCAITTVYSLNAYKFVASAMQLASIAVLAIAAIAAAFFLFRSTKTTQTSDADSAGALAPSPWIVAGLSLVLTSACFVSRSATMLWMRPASAGIVSMLALAALAILLIAAWSRRRGWSANHYLALATGAVLTYSWFGLSQFLMGQTNLGTPTTLVDDVGQVVEIAVILALIGVAARLQRNGRSTRS
jgi:hypothetical protein